MTDHSTLVADIGATNARFAILAGGRIAATETYPVAAHATPEAAARQFLAGPGAGHSPVRAAIAAAGVVHQGRVTMTNAAWIVDAARLREGLGLASVEVLNDFEALGWALPGLAADDLFVVGGPRPGPGGTMAVMGPGSGFGLGALARGPQGDLVLVTEGGHATLPAEDKREDSIIRTLRDRLHHVSVERVLSGPGLVQLYHAVAVTDGLVVRDRDSAGIVAHALAGDCEGSVATLEAFCAFLGGVAGNVALTLGATGGVYIAGGIVPRFTEFLARSAFRERFEAKGRLREYLARIPTAVITHPFPAFVGLGRWLAAHE